MDFFQEFKSEYAVLIIRLIAGILFLFQGYDKIFRLRLSKTGEAATYALSSLHLPGSLVKFIAVVTAIVEFSGGIMLISGFLILPACYMLMAGLLPITIAMAIREPVWNMETVWPRLVLLTFLMLAPEQVHTLSLDYVLKTYGS